MKTRPLVFWLIRHTRRRIDYRIFVDVARAAQALEPRGALSFSRGFQFDQVNDSEPFSLNYERMSSLAVSKIYGFRWKFMTGSFLDGLEFDDRQDLGDGHTFLCKKLILTIKPALVIWMVNVGV
jgi:hypothetical protein